MPIYELFGFSQEGGGVICIITFAYRTPVICQANNPKDHGPLFLNKTDSVQGANAQNGLLGEFILSIRDAASLGYCIAADQH